MNRKSQKKNTTSDPRSGPIRQGSRLYRMLEMIAAEIARRLRSNESAVGQRAKDRATNGAITKPDDDR
jgi:hypothetical protein